MQPNILPIGLPTGLPSWLSTGVLTLLFFLGSALVPACAGPSSETVRLGMQSPTASPRLSLGAVDVRGKETAQEDQERGEAWRQQTTPNQGDPWLFGISPSFLPNLGLTGTLAREVGVWRKGGLAIEAEFTQQFLDDTSFTDSSNPAAGDWSQAKLGTRWAYPFDPARWVTLRTGAVWFNARGKPNIINDPGHYLGVYVEFGLEARITEHWIVGPAIMAMLAYDGEDREEHVVPQVTWRILYRP